MGPLLPDLAHLIIEIEEELGVRSSITEFEQEMRGRDPRRDNQEEESSEEEPEIDDGLAHSTGQAFRQQLMTGLLQQL